MLIQENHFLPNKFEYAHYPFTGKCMEILGRSYMLITSGSWRVERDEIALEIVDLLNSQHNNDYDNFPFNVFSHALSSSGTSTNPKLSKKKRKEITWCVQYVDMLIWTVLKLAGFIWCLLWLCNRNAYHGASPYTLGILAHSTWKLNVPVGFGYFQVNGEKKLHVNVIW